MLEDADFEELFRRDYPGLVSFGVGMLGDVDVARDLAQETMARVNANWSTVAVAEAPIAWARRVLINLVIDHQRRVGAERRALERIAVTPVDVDQAGATHSEDDEFARLVSVLPQQQRLVATLRYVNDLSITQIADALSIAPGTVKAHLWKARRSIGRLIEEEETPA